MKKSRGILVLVLAALLTAGMIYMAAVGVGESGTGAAKNINLGLDLAGGVSITYGTVIDNPTAEQMSDTIYKLQKRVEKESTEAQVYQEGSNRINVEIPGVQDANEVLEKLGKPGSLEFWDYQGNVILEGTDIADARAVSTKDQMENVSYAVSLTLTDEGAKKFATATEENLGMPLPIVYDNEIIREPTVQAVITNGQAQISNMASFEDAE